MGINKSIKQLVVGPTNCNASSCQDTEQLTRTSYKEHERSHHPSDEVTAKVSLRNQHYYIGVGSKLRVGWAIVYSKRGHASLLRSTYIQCVSARFISTMYNQPYTRKRKFSKRKPSILCPKIARQYNNNTGIGTYTHTCK